MTTTTTTITTKSYTTAYDEPDAGASLDEALVEAWDGTLEELQEAIERWSDTEKMQYIIARDELMLAHDSAVNAMDDIEIYDGVESLTKLAEQFVDDGLFGEIPEKITYYLDYEAIGRDLRHDGYTETTIAGERLVYLAQ